MTPKPKCLRPNPKALNPKPEALNPEPETLNPKPQARTLAKVAAYAVRACDRGGIVGDSGLPLQGLGFKGLKA